MAKLNKEEQARIAGMNYALQLVDKYGVEYLREDLKKRGTLGMPLGVSQKEYSEYSTKVKRKILDNIEIVVLLTLHDQFGFGKKRLEDFILRFGRKCECALDPENADLQMYCDILKEETGLDIHVNTGELTVRI